jgi:hypothetical protein
MEFLVDFTEEQQQAWDTPIDETDDGWKTKTTRMNKNGKLVFSLPNNFFGNLCSYLILTSLESTWLDLMILLYSALCLSLEVAWFIDACMQHSVRKFFDKASEKKVTTLCASIDFRLFATRIWPWSVLQDLLYALLKSKRKMQWLVWGSFGILSSSPPPWRWWHIFLIEVLLLCFHRCGIECSWDIHIESMSTSRSRRDSVDTNSGARLAVKTSSSRTRKRMKAFAKRVTHKSRFLLTHFSFPYKKQISGDGFFPLQVPTSSMLGD